MIALFAATLASGLALRRETVRYPRMVATLVALDISLCALAAARAIRQGGMTTWYAVLTVWPE